MPDVARGTALCERCRLWFNIIKGGVIRRHDNAQGNLCPGSWLEPADPIVRPWASRFDAPIHPSKIALRRIAGDLA